MGEVCTKHIDIFFLEREHVRMGEMPPPPPNNNNDNNNNNNNNKRMIKIKIRIKNF